MLLCHQILILLLSYKKRKESPPIFWFAQNDFGWESL